MPLKSSLHPSTRFSQSHLLKLLLFCIWLGPSHAYSDSANLRQATFRSGAFMGSYQGKDVSSGTFTTDVTLEVELVNFTSTREAIVLNSVITNESGLGQTRYFAVGGGQRFYFNDAFVSDSQSDGNMVLIKPDWVFYGGWEGHVGQFLVLPLTPILATYTTLLAITGTAGVQKVFSKRYSADVQLGYTYGYSVTSSVSVTASIIQVLAGVSYSF